MARLVEQYNLETNLFQTAEQRRVSEEVRQRFGLKPESVQFLKEGSDVDGICSVTVGAKGSVLLVFANGMLVVPPKRG